MNEIPSMWRTELLHPQFVHFTVALLLFGSLLWLLSFLFGEKKRPLLSNAGQILIITGTAISWLTIYTGTLADAEVGRTLCDPTVLEGHEYNAFIMAYVFSGISVVLLLNKFTAIFKRFKKGIHLLLLLAIITGNVYLTYTAHMGAKVVYQQGGGVYHPSQDCHEFE